MPLGRRQAPQATTKQVSIGPEPAGALPVELGPRPVLRFSPCRAAASGASAARAQADRSFRTDRWEAHLGSFPGPSASRAAGLGLSLQDDSTPCATRHRATPPAARVRAFLKPGTSRAVQHWPACFCRPNRNASGAWRSGHLRSVHSDPKPPGLLPSLLRVTRWSLPRSHLVPCHRGGSGACPACVEDNAGIELHSKEEPCDLFP